MNKDSIKSYLERLAGYANSYLTADNIYNDEVISLSQMGYVNTAIISKAMWDNLNLHIKTCERDDNKELYIPVILSIVILGFIKNYIDYQPEPQVGEIVEKDRIRYSVVRISGDKIVIKNAAGSETRYLTRKQYATYIITTSDKETDGRRLKIGFENYRKFFNSVIKGGIGKKLPSKFQSKYLIISRKEIYDSFKNVNIDDVNVKVYSSLPIRYIASSGKITDNIPIDPMVYIVNDYETAEQYVLGKYNIETVFVIGADKYREYVYKIAGDLRAERAKNAIFVGRETIETFENLRRWNWTREEMVAYKDVFEPQIKIVSDSQISEKIKQFQKIIEAFEDEYKVSLLNEFSDELRKVSRIIIPNVKSRMNNKLKILKEEFKCKTTEIIDNIFWDRGLDDSERVACRVIEAFNEVVDAVNYEKWSLFKNNFTKSYVIVPKDHLDDISSELKNGKSKAVLYSDFLKSQKQIRKEVVFFSIYGKKHFEETFLTEEFKPCFILYPHEAEYYKLLANKYEQEIKDELLNEDRFFLTGIKFQEAAMPESFDEKTMRLLNAIDKDSEQDQNIQKIEYGETINISCCLEFENGETTNIDSSSSVLLCTPEKTEILTVDKLRVGDSVRIYENVHKDKLWDIALKSDTQGVFQKIEEAALYWKQALSEYKGTNDLSTDQLYEQLMDNGLSRIKNSNTIERWSDVDSDIKFPAIPRNMQVIKKTIANPDFDSHYQDIIKKRRAYRGIMISLGRDLSDEIATYIQSGGKKVGEQLSKFDDNVRKGIADSNAPQRTIKNITYIQDESGDE